MIRDEPNAPCSGLKPVSLDTVPFGTYSGKRSFKPTAASSDRLGGVARGTAFQAYSGLAQLRSNKIMARPFFTYVLRCADGSYYVGHTDDVERRMNQHETGAGSGYTATRLPVQLVWFEEFPTREEAKAAELQIKNWSRRKKEALIGGRIDELKQAARKDWASYRRRRA